MIITEKLKQRLTVAHNRSLEVFRPHDTDPSMQYQMLHVILFEDADQTENTQRGPRQMMQSPWRLNLLITRIQPDAAWDIHFLKRTEWA